MPGEPDFLGHVRQLRVDTLRPTQGQLLSSSRVRSVLGHVEKFDAFVHENQDTAATALCNICGSITDWRRQVAVRAVSRLGACGLLQRACQCTGSWDEPDPSARFELTDRGYDYAQTIDDLTRWAKRLASAQRLQPERRHAQ
jgi:hypothetical protein